jgi:6-phosphogluconate dehydrogenase
VGTKRLPVTHIIYQETGLGVSQFIAEWVAKEHPSEWLTSAILETYLIEDCKYDIARAQISTAFRNIYTGTSYWSGGKIERHPTKFATYRVVPNNVKKKVPLVDYIFDETTSESEATPIIEEVTVQEPDYVVSYVGRTGTGHLVKINGDIYTCKKL